MEKVTVLKGRIPVVKTVRRTSGYINCGECSSQSYDPHFPQAPVGLNGKTNFYFCASLGRLLGTAADMNAPGECPRRGRIRSFRQIRLTH